MIPHFYARCPYCHNPRKLSWLGTGTKYADLHTQWLQQKIIELYLLSLLQDRHLFNGLFSRTTWVSRYQPPIWILMNQQMMGWRWRQLDHMQIICTSLQTDNHASTSLLKFFTGQMRFLTPNQHCQSTEGSTYCTQICTIITNLAE